MKLATLRVPVVRIVPGRGSVGPLLLKMNKDHWSRCSEWTGFSERPAGVVNPVAFLGVGVSMESTQLHPYVVQLASV